VLYAYALVAAAAALIIWRMLLPADLRLNRRYLARFLRDSAGKGPSKLRLAKIPLWLSGADNEEFVCYHVEAEFHDGSRQQATVQILYPLESLQREREQQQKPHMAEDFNAMQNPTRLGGPSTPQDDAARFKEDPLRELTAERKLIAQKTEQFDREIEQLRLLQSCGDFFPRLIAYDRTRHIAVLTAVGSKRLDTTLHACPRDSRLPLLQDALVRLAVFHASCGNLALSLPDPSSHAAPAIRSQIAGTLAFLVSAGEMPKDGELTPLLDATAPIWSAGANYTGVRLADASPRALYVHNGTVSPLNYGQLKLGITLLDVVELLCDPAVPLTPEEEIALFKHYLRARFPAEDADKRAFLELLRLGVYYRLTLARHLAEYAALLERAPRDRRGSVAMPYWDDKVRERNLAALRFYLAQDTELATLSQALPRLTSQVQC